jgi:hypothetical protein
LNVVFHDPAAEVVITNSGNVAVLVAVNCVLVGDDLAPVAGVYPAAAPVPTDLVLPRVKVADLATTGFLLTAGESQPFKGLLPGASGGQIKTIALVGVDGTATVSGGQIDISN